jgi:hypothetical protein
MKQTENVVKTGGVKFYPSVLRSNSGTVLAEQNINGCGSKHKQIEPAILTQKKCSNNTNLTLTKTHKTRSQENLANSPTSAAINAL